jgi:nucleoside-diphosphate-sugar epimerase
MVVKNIKKVMITGASGYIASWIVKSLLEDGIDVNATVRDPSNKVKIDHLKLMEGDGKGKLTLFTADLLKEGSFDEAAKGCDIVFHTASPFFISGFKDAQKSLVDPALKGTRNVLGAVNKSNSVKRVVLTSSIAAIYGDAKELKLLSISSFTEKEWNETSSVKHQPYSYSKTIAEKEAWKIQKEQNSWDLVVINPGMVFGPSLSQRVDSTSISFMKQLGDGSMKMGVPKYNLGMVDVRDVAKAHVLAGSNERASGRHILVSGEYSFLEISNMLIKAFGKKYPFPQKEVPKWLVWLLAPNGMSRKMISNNLGYEISFDNSKSINSLGVNYTPMEKTVTDHFNQLINDNLLNVNI